MHKCDSCGKVVVNEQDYMCPHCGAVSNKHCDHSTHLPDDKYNRANDYRTAAEEHKSKTYDYEKAPKTDASQKFDINDLANIKNAEDVKKVAKKAFIEQDKNGKKKFKPVAIVLIVIFAINIFANLMSVAFDAVDSVFEEIAGELPDSWVGYELGEETIIHDFELVSCFKGGSFDRENDCLTLQMTDVYFEHYQTRNDEYEKITDEWQSEFSLPGQYLYYGKTPISVVIFTEAQVKNPKYHEELYERVINLSAEVTEFGEIKVYGIASQLRNLKGQNVYIQIYSLKVENENISTKEEFDMNFYLPFNFVGISKDDEVAFYNIYKNYEDETKVDVDVVDLYDQYVPDEYVECIEFNDTDSGYIFESVPYTEMVTLVD